MSVVSTSDAKVDQFGNMTFVDRVFSKEKESLYKEEIKGLSFVN